jgi:ketosteroid isomerase-like protein
MSQENVEIVRRATAEFDESQPLSESFAPDFVWDTRTDRVYPEQKEFHGWDGFFEFIEDWLDAYDEWDNEIGDVLDAGGSQVVILCHQRGRLQDSQAWVELDYGLVYTVEEGLIRRIQVYDTPEEALEAAGLRE